MFIFDGNGYYGGAGATLKLSTFMAWYAQHAEAEEARAQLDTAATDDPACQSSRAEAQTAAPGPESAPSAHSAMEAPAVHAQQGALASKAGTDKPSGEERLVLLSTNTDSVLHIQADVQMARIPGRDNDYCIDLSHQVRDSVFVYRQLGYLPGGDGVPICTIISVFRSHTQGSSRAALLAQSVLL